MKKGFTNLTSKIPFYAYSKGVILLDDGTLYTGFKLTGMDTTSLSPQDLENIKSKIKNVFEVLPVGYRVQIIHDYDSADMTPVFDLQKKMRSTNPIAIEFQKSYFDHLANQTGIYEIGIYVYIIRPAKTSKNGFNNLFEKLLSYDFFSIFSKKQESREDKLENTLRRYSQELLELSERVRFNFKNLISLESFSLNKADFIQLSSKLLNPEIILPKKTLEQSKNKHESEAINCLTLREQVVHTGIEEYKDYLKIGNQYATILSLKLPREYSNECESEIILNCLDFPFCWSFNIEILDTSGINSKLEARQKRKHAFIASSNNPNLSSSVSKGELEQALIDQNKFKFNWCDVSYSFIIYADSIETLKERRTKLISIYRHVMETLLITEQSTQLENFVASLPGVGYKHKRKFLFSSLNMSDIAPLSEPSHGTKNTSCYLTTIRNTLFKFSTFSDEFNNWNQVVIGKTGSGKSFIVNYILNLSLMNADSPRVMILDLGQSFKRTTEIWGGEYITIDLDNPDCGLNPLPLRNILLNEGNTVKEVFEFTIQLLLLMAGFNNEHKFHKRIIKLALTKTYEDTAPHDPILQDFYNVLCTPEEIISDDSDRQIARELSKLMEEYVGDGTYAKLFNRKSSLTHKSDFFCFDFKNANQNTEIREIATYILGGYIYRKMVENPLPKFIIFDEFSTTMEHATGAALCEMISKNCRKHGASFISISQQVKDFLKHNSSETLYRQSNFKWFLKMDDNLEELKNTLNLTPTDVDNIQDLDTVKGEYSEVYLIYDKKKTTLRFSPDPLIYWACTNDANDRRILLSYIEYYKYRAIDTLFNPHLSEIELIKLKNQFNKTQANSMLNILKLLAFKYPKGINSDVIENDPISLLMMNPQTDGVKCA